MVVALSQEDKSTDTASKILEGIDAPRFDVVFDLEREVTQAYDRTNAYLIGKDGKVAQIFPMLIHARPSWNAILSEIDRLAPRRD